MVSCKVEIVSLREVDHTANCIERNYRSTRLPRMQSPLSDKQPNTFYLKLILSNF
jgi:hypothetical protein